MKHTPGPWRQQGVNVVDDRGIIAAIWGQYPARDADEVLANIRLIAAAPEMYEALKKALEVIEEYTSGYSPLTKKDKEALEIVRKAINKAEGK